MLNLGWIEQAGPVGRVRGRPTPAEAFGQVEITLQRVTIRITAAPNTDEVVVTTVRGDTSLPDLGQHGVFTPLLGKVIEYGWTMTNQRGYSDGLQFRFLDLDTRDESTLQFEAAAAVLFVRRVV